MAGKAHLALSADTRQHVQLVSAELSLLLGAGQIDHALLEDVTQQIQGFYKMVARVQISVMLQSEPVTTHGIENAHAG